MGTVNKINVNGQVVDISNSCIEITDNITANDVSYDASTQYDENTIGNELNRLTENLEIIDNSLTEEEITITSNDESETYLKINTNGIYTKGIYDLNGNSLFSDNSDNSDSDSKYFIKGQFYKKETTKPIGIIAAGQSNIDGRNSYSDLPNDFITNNNKIHICKNINGTFNDFSISETEKWGFDYIVYNYLTNESYGNQNDLYVMKYSMGGTSIDKDGATDYHWTADYEELNDIKYSLLSTLEKIIRNASENNQSFDIKAILWHQGEGDSDKKYVAEKYYNNLKNMLSYIRGIVGNPKLHFFCGNISQNNKTNLYKDIINSALESLNQSDPYFHCIDMSDAPLQDSWHFTASASEYFGKKVYDAMIDANIIQGDKLNPIKNW